MLWFHQRPGHRLAGQIKGFLGALGFINRLRLPSFFNQRVDF